MISHVAASFQPSESCSIYNIIIVAVLKAEGAAFSHQAFFIFTTDVGVVTVLRGKCEAWNNVCSNYYVQYLDLAEKKNVNPWSSQD